MTREELVVQRLNTLEQRIKRAVEKGNVENIKLAITEQNGYIDALTDLGYAPIDNEDEAECIVGDDGCTYWIYKYTSIADRTGRG